MWEKIATKILHILSHILSTTGLGYVTLETKNVVTR
jgi:hypothetical protein